MRTEVPTSRRLVYQSTPINFGLLEPTLNPESGKQNWESTGGKETEWHMLSYIGQEGKWNRAIR